VEREVFERRYLVAQPNFDESLWRLSGQLPAVAGRTFVEALDQKADQLPPGGGGSRTTRYPDALWAISLDSLTGTDGASIDSATPLLTVFVDADHATATNGEAGVVVEAGPRIGPDTIEAILCDGVIEVTGRTRDGTPVNMGRRSRTIPPRLKRFVLARDGAISTIEGCSSRYRHDLRSSTQYRVPPPTGGSSSTDTDTPSTPNRHPTADDSTNHPSTPHPRTRCEVNPLRSVNMGPEDAVDVSQLRAHRSSYMNWESPGLNSCSRTVAFSTLFDLLAGGDETATGSAPDLHG
jgi:hypothetical protein